MINPSLLKTVRYLVVGATAPLSRTKPSVTVYGVVSAAVIVAAMSQQYWLCGRVQFDGEKRSKPGSRHFSMAAASSISVVCFQ
jgi:hypothetical protein